MKKIFFALLLFSGIVFSQKLPDFELTDEWLNKIESMIPEQNGFAQKKKKELLIFSLHTGFKHWTIPHTEAVMKLIAEKSGNFNVTLTKDISFFEKNRLKAFDVVLLNNNCSVGPRRDMFWDVLNEDPSLSEARKLEKAQQLERNLINFVRIGNGLVLMHGGIVMQNNSLEFSEMAGGSFDYHPQQQELHLRLADPDHPLVADFDPQGFSHIDEPYFFKNAYFRYNFKPLLYVELDKIQMKRKRPSDAIKYVSWIKRYGKGRVFYSSPSHNAQSMENPQLLAFFNKGLNYAAGLLKCDDAPMGLPNK
jgi:type 1 glutamine amidotransferase